VLARFRSLVAGLVAFTATGLVVLNYQALAALPMLS
jgi:hypothetical protein